jgi:hypothetical protein
VNIIELLHVPFPTALKKDKKEKEILVLPFDMTNTSAHEDSFKAIIKEFGKVSLDFIFCNL